MIKKRRFDGKQNHGGKENSKKIKVKGTVVGYMFYIILESWRIKKKKKMASSLAPNKTKLPSHEGHDWPQKAAVSIRACSCGTQSQKLSSPSAWCDNSPNAPSTHIMARSQEASAFRRPLRLCCDQPHHHSLVLKDDNLALFSLCVFITIKRGS